jgi:peptidoglycan/LPS O-acetylase OafA/YrhL
MAFAVVVYHFVNWFPVFTQGQFAADTAKKIGVYGVEGFFVISGFCFFYLYGAETLTPRGMGSFHLKRFFRIAPLYYLAVGCNLLFGFVGGGAPYTRRFLLENATLTFGLWHPSHSFLTGGWSIGIEYVFYLAFPFLAWAAARWKPFLALAAVVALAASMPATFVQVPAAAREGNLNWHTYVHVMNHAFLFFLGGLVAQARLAFRARVGTLTFLVLGTALFLAFTLRYRNFYDDFLIMQGWPRYYFCLLCFAGVGLFAFYDFPDSPVKTAGKFLGDVSYSVYLLHPLVKEGMTRLIPGLGTRLGFLLGLGLTLGLSALTFRFIEKPMMGLGRRLGR